MTDARVGAGAAGASADDLRALGLLPAEAVAVFASGSRVAGWAHANSDVDLYVVCERRAELQSDTYARVGAAVVPVVVRFDASGTRWDVEIWVERDVDDLLDKVARFDPEGPQAAADDLDDEEIDFLHRLTIAVPIAGEDWLAVRRARLSASGVRALVTSRAFNHADALIDDAVGQLASADVESAVLSARLAFGLVVDGLLASYGSLSPAPKWRARKLGQVCPAELEFETYWEVETMRDFDPAEPERWVRDVLELSQRIVGSVDIS